MLIQICMAEDRAAQYASIIAADGPVVRSKAGGVREHPLAKLELAYRSFVVRSLHRLNLDVEPPRGSFGRPTGGRPLGGEAMAPSCAASGTSC